MISHTVLVLAEGFTEELSATRVAAAIGRGLEADGRLKCDLCPLDPAADTSTGSLVTSRSGRDVRGPAQADERTRPPSKRLDELDYDRRMRAARAVVIARAQLDDRTLAGSVVFEAATRARQGGVPAYAVAAHDELDPFEARIVDLQVVLQARTAHALRAAGQKLAMLV